MFLTLLRTLNDRERIAKFKWGDGSGGREYVAHGFYGPSRANAIEMRTMTWLVAKHIYCILIVPFLLLDHTIQSLLAVCSKLSSTDFAISLFFWCSSDPELTSGGVCVSP